ncbi:MAG: restriction endonuclease [Planctomycetaceae bacterium]|nr:restriction endonuclease [Planctomycetaceae bacterium]
MPSDANPKSDESCQADASKWDRPVLKQLWNLIRQEQDIEGWSKGRAFEYLVIRAFELEGATIGWPYRVNYPQRFGTMEQIDGYVHLEGVTFLIESKDYSDPMSIEAIAKLRFRLEGRPAATMGVVFARSNFSLPTEVFAQFCSPLNVLLWSADDLDYAIEEGTMIKGLRDKYDFAVKFGLPLLALRSV